MDLFGISILFSFKNKIFKNNLFKYLRVVSNETSWAFSSTSKMFLQ